MSKEVTTVLRTLSVLAMLSAPAAASAATSSEAITLETIGAVRMATPDEWRHRTADLRSAPDHVQDRGRLGGVPAVAR